MKTVLLVGLADPLVLTWGAAQGSIHHLRPWLCWSEFGLLAHEGRNLQHHWAEQQRKTSKFGFGEHKRLWIRNNIGWVTFYYNDWTQCSVCVPFSTLFFPVFIFRWFVLIFACTCRLQRGDIKSMLLYDMTSSLHITTKLRISCVYHRKTIKLNGELAT